MFESTDPRDVALAIVSAWVPVATHVCAWTTAGRIDMSMPEHRNEEIVLVRIGCAFSLGFMAL
jgi:hypothetical protein